MKHLIHILLLINLAFTACNNENIVNITPDDHSPMWPMPGHDARNTSNLIAQKTTINPVTQGALDWSYNFPQVGYSDGAEFCVDSKSNFYILSQQGPPSIHKLYKFRPDGTVIWIVDSLTSENYASYALSSDEKTFYITAYKNINANIEINLFAIDSSGAIKWTFPNAYINKPVIGLNNAVIFKSNLGITAVNPNGQLLWSNANIDMGSNVSEWAVDREGSVYVGGGSLRKYSKDGIYQWDFDPNNDVSFTKYIVIDGYNNIYFTDISYDSTSGTRLFSLTKDGNLRWTDKSQIFFELAITSDNKIIAGGDSIKALDMNGALIWSRPTLQSNTGGCESIILDNENNIYYLIDLHTFISAMSSSGVYLWTFNIGMFSTLPKLSLMPNGRVLFAPKRAYEIFSIK